jgi:hypothetical protein
MVSMAALVVVKNMVLADFSKIVQNQFECSSEWKDSGFGSAAMDFAWAF